MAFLGLFMIPFIMSISSPMMRRCPIITDRTAFEDFDRRGFFDFLRFALRLRADCSISCFA